MALSKFKKLFIEEEVNENDIEQYLNEYQTKEKIVDDLLNVNCNTECILNIESIYEMNDLVNFESSIFKIDDIRKVLPDSLPNEAKKESVLGMMQVTNLSLDSILEDAEKRKNILSSVNNKFLDDTNKIIEDSNSEIKELEDRINELKSTITNRKKSQEQQEEIIKSEIDKIDEIVNFIK